MAVLASETGDGMTLDAPLTTGRNLDNGAGGSGTRAWADTGDYIKSNGSNGFMADIESGKALVSMGSSINASEREVSVRWGTQCSRSLSGVTGFFRVA